MKLKFLAAALAAVSGFAVAGVPSTSHEVLMSGATAQDPGLLSLLRVKCATGTLDAYTAPGVAAAMYVCTYNGTAYTIQKESAAGSSNGIDPVRNGTTLTFLDTTAIDTTAERTSACTSSAVAASGAQQAYTAWSCSIGTKAAVPTIGFADVEPALFGKSAAGLTVKAANQLIFGIQVTKVLRDALQTAQGLVAGNETTANMPSLSEAQVAGILAAGGIIDVADLGVAGGGDLYLARRGDTSGTEKTNESYFLQQNLINPPPLAMWTPDVVSSDEATYCGSNPVYVFGGSGSGDVRGCLKYHNDNGRYALGINSTESKQTTAATTEGGWRWVKLNGYAPTTANAIRGLYNLWVEQAIMKNASYGSATDTGRVFDLYANNLGTLASEISSTLKLWDDANCGGQPAGECHTGLMALPNKITGVNGGVCSDTFAAAGTTPDSDPVNVSTNSLSGSANNASTRHAAVCPPRL